MFDLPYTLIEQTAHYAHSPMASLIASMIKFPPEKKSEAYADLICTEEDKAVIYEIITTMAENGKLSLLLKKNYMQGLGSRINHVHPLKFLSTIVTHPHLRECLQGFYGDYFKRNGFMDGLAPSLTREADKGKLDQYINDFANEVSVSKEEVAAYFENRDWEGLVRIFTN